MPRGSDHGPSVKRPEQYEAMRDEGMSKGKAARISNAGRPASRKGGRSPTYEDMTKAAPNKRKARPTQPMDT
ncbi:MAG: hypothetical protein FWJ72_13655, partial [Acidimicrobiia bacterium]